MNGALVSEGCEKRCPGCSHRGLSAEASESAKHDWLASRLSELLAPGLLGSPQGVQGDSRLGYRSKVRLRAEWDAGSSRWKLGLRVRIGPKEYEVIDIPRCPVHSPEVRRVHAVLAGDLSPRLPLVYVAVSGSLVTLVLKARRSSELEALVREEKLARALRSAGVEGLFACFNPSAGDRVFAAGGWYHAWGAELARDGSGLWHGPESFQQLIPSLYEGALEEARLFLNPGEGDSVADLCSGTGASLRIWRDSGARTLGVELGGEAVRCAELNAGPGSLLRGRVSERLPQLDEWSRLKAGRRLLFANPPRLGLEDPVCRWIGESFRPERVAYLSCSAGSLARDLSILRDSGYALRRIAPYDFFPHTDHVEALALLERVS